MRLLWFTIGAGVILLIFTVLSDNAPTEDALSPDELALREAIDDVCGVTTATTGADLLNLFGEPDQKLGSAEDGFLSMLWQRDIDVAASVASSMRDDIREDHCDMAYSWLIDGIKSPVRLVFDRRDRLVDAVIG
jgi:hypothetical protein